MNSETNINATLLINNFISKFGDEGIENHDIFKVE